MRLFWLMCLGLALPAQAELVLHGRSTVWAMGMEGSGQETLWLDKNRLRRDLSDRGRDYSQLYDLDRRRVVLIDHAAHRAEIHSMASLSQRVAQEARGDLKYTRPQHKFSLKPTGKKRQLQEWSCQENSLRVSAPAEVGNEKVEFVMQGTVWIAGQVAEQAEANRLAKALQSPDLYLDIPTLGRSPEQARALAETLRRILPKGMICGLEVDLQYVGSGRIAELSKKLASRLAIRVDSYQRKRIPAGTFDIPKNYYLVQK
jgi:hypothetical protein